MPGFDRLQVRKLGLGRPHVGRARRRLLVGDEGIHGADRAVGGLKRDGRCVIGCLGIGKGRIDRNNFKRGSGLPVDQGERRREKPFGGGGECRRQRERCRVEGAVFPPEFRGRIVLGGKSVKACERGLAASLRNLGPHCGDLTRERLVAVAEYDPVSGNERKAPNILTTEGAVVAGLLQPGRNPVPAVRRRMGGQVIRQQPFRVGGNVINGPRQEVRKAFGERRRGQ